jgi:hypothetical protein
VSLTRSPRTFGIVYRRVRWGRRYASLGRRWDTASFTARAFFATADTIFEGTALSTRSMHSFEGRELFDSSGYKVGDIETVLRGDPRFALVKSGLFGTIRRLVPLNDIRESGEDLVVPYSKDKVKLAPAPAADRRLSRAERERLCRYYRSGNDAGLKRGAWTGVEGSGR